MKHETGLFLDGHQLEPVRTNTYPSIDEDAGDGEFSQYRVVIGILTVHYFLDATSVVKIDSSHYLDLDIEEDNDDDNHAWVIVKNSSTYRDAFTGNCTLYNSVTNNCKVKNSDISRSSLKISELHPLVNLSVSGSRLENATISDGSTILNSSIINSTVVTEGPGVYVEGSTLKNSSFSAKGTLHLSGCKFNETSVHAINFVRICDSRMNEMYMKIEDCHIPNRLYFFSIDFPSVTLYFYQTGSDAFAITRQGGGFDMNVDDPEFREKLKELLIDCEQLLPDDTVKYVMDSIRSRRNLIQALWAEFERGLGDPI